MFAPMSAVIQTSQNRYGTTRKGHANTFHRHIPTGGAGVPLTCARDCGGVAARVPMEVGRNASDTPIPGGAWCYGEPLQ